MSKQRFSPDSPEVKAILCDVWRSAKGSYYRITPEGRHVAASVKRELITLGMCGVIASRLLAAANLPTKPFIHNRTPNRPKPTVERSSTGEFDQSNTRPLEMEAAVVEHEIPSPNLKIAETAALQEPTKRTRHRQTPEEIKHDRLIAEIKAEAQRLKQARESERVLARKYPLIQSNSGKVGIWFQESGRTELFYTVEECLAFRRGLAEDQSSYCYTKGVAAGTQVEEDSDIDPDEVSEEEILTSDE